MFWRDLHKYDFCIRDFIKTTELGLPYQSDPLFRGSLNIWTICRLVVQGCTSLFCPVPRPENRPSIVVRSLYWYIQYIYIFLFCSACSSHYIYEGGRMSSLWIIESWVICSVSARSVLYEKSYMFWFPYFLFILTKSLLLLVYYWSKLITCQTVVSDMSLLVIRSRYRRLWGGAPGGGSRATSRPRVETRRCPIDVGWGFELRVHI